MTSDPVPSTSVATRLRGVGFHPAGVALIAIGAVVVLAAYTVLPWFRSGSGFFANAGSHTTFGDLHSFLTTMKAQADASPAAGHVHFSTSLPYFDWLAWALLPAVVVVGALAVSPVGARFALIRVLCSIIALCGAAATVFAVDLFAVDKRAGNAPVPSFGDFLRHTGVGAWAAVVGYVLIMIACLLPRPRPLRV